MPETLVSRPHIASGRQSDFHSDDAGSTPAGATMLEIDRPKLYSAQFKNVLRLAKWMKLRISCTCKHCYVKVIEVVVRAVNKI